MVPIRVPLVDISRQMADNPGMMLEPDVVRDPLAVWMAQKYGADSSLAQLIVQVRQASQEEDEEAGEVEGPEDILGLFVLLDGLDEAAISRIAILEYLQLLLQHEPCHFPLVTSRPGIVGFAEKEMLAYSGFVACYMSRLSTNNAVGLAASILSRAKETETRVQRMLAAWRQKPGSLQARPHL